MQKLKIELDLTEILNNLNISDLEHLIKKAATLISQRKAKNKKHLESELLHQLNHVYVPSQEHLKQFFILTEKRDQGIISNKELQELQLLIDEEEAYQVERIKLLGQLGQLWQLPILDVVKKLGLKPIESA